MYKDSIIHRGEIRKQKTAEGVLMQNLGAGKLMNALHWNMDDGSIVEWHQHPAEQFGYCIKGGFRIFYKTGDADVIEEYEIHGGDCYFIPPNVPHRFIALGETEAIDIFNPIKVDIPKEIK